MSLTRMWLLQKLKEVIKKMSEQIIAQDPLEIKQNISLIDEVKNASPLDDILQERLKATEMSVRPMFQSEDTDRLKDMLKVEDDEAFNKMVDNIIDCYHSKGYLVFMSKLQNNGSEDRINQNLVVSKGYKVDDLKIATKEFEKLAEELSKKREEK